MEKKEKLTKALKVLLIKKLEKIINEMENSSKRGLNKVKEEIILTTLNQCKILLKTT